MTLSGEMGYPGGNAAYCATKGAVGMIAETLALELAPYNIYVNAIGPSLVVTSCFQQFLVMFFMQREGNVRSDRHLMIGHQD